MFSLTAFHGLGGRFAHVLLRSLPRGHLDSGDLAKEQLSIQRHVHLRLGSNLCGDQSHNRGIQPLRPGEG